MPDLRKIYHNGVLTHNDIICYNEKSKTKIEVNFHLAVAADRSKQTDRFIFCCFAEAFTNGSHSLHASLFVGIRIFISFCIDFVFNKAKAAAAPATLRIRSSISQDPVAKII